jgi:hypothetical protein
LLHGYFFLGGVTSSAARALPQESGVARHGRNLGGTKRGGRGRGTLTPHARKRPRATQPRNQPTAGVPAQTPLVCRPGLPRTTMSSPKPATTSEAARPPGLTTSRFRPQPPHPPAVFSLLAHPSP